MQDQIDRHDVWSLDATLDRAMDALRLPDGDRDVTTLSGGERRRVALCRLLLSSPDLLLLDEPTNHLDAESVAWLERFLERYKGTVVAVTHDRYFLDNVAGWILELDRGKGLPFEGNYSSWLEQKQARLAVEEKTESARRRTLARELEWVRMSPKARHAKSKARLAALRAAARRGAEREARQGRDPHPGRPAARRRRRRGRATSRKGFGDRLLFEDLTFSLPPGGIVGVIGPNGAGKTTLFRMIAGEEQPDAGKLTRRRDGRARLRRPVARRPRRPRTPSGRRSPATTTRSSSASARSTRASTSPGSTSAAPTSRSASATSPAASATASTSRSCCARGGNVLLLDEPTNDLDVDTLRALEEALLDFAGCAVVISHDRWFLDRIATHILAFEGDSQVTWFEGSYQEYADWVRETRGPEALEPHRIKYKPLVRA